MRAGTLRHKIIIQAPVTTKDKYGATVTTWVDYREARASIEQIKSWEKAAIAGTFPGADYTITMRYMAGVTSAMRIYHPTTGVYYSILGTPANTDGRNRELVITAQSGLKVT